MTAHGDAGKGSELPGSRREQGFHMPKTQTIITADADDLAFRAAELFKAAARAKGCSWGCPLNRDQNLIAAKKPERPGRIVPGKDSRPYGC